MSYYYRSNRSASPYQSGSYSYPFNKSRSPTNRYRPTSPPINDISYSDVQESDSTIQEKDIRLLQQDDDQVWTQDRDLDYEKRFPAEWNERFESDLGYEERIKDDQRYPEDTKEQFYDARYNEQLHSQIYPDEFNGSKYYDHFQNQRYQEKRYYEEKRYHDNFVNPDIKDLSDSEHDDNNTVRAQSPIPNYFEYKRRAKSPPVEVDTDAKLVGYALMFTLFYFVAIHIFPVLELFPMLLHAKMGNVVASVVLVLISIALGYNTALQRLLWIRYFKKLRKHRMFSSCFYFIVLVTNLYLSKYITGWVFSILFQINHIPVLGSIIVLGILGFIIFLFCITAFYTSAKFSYSITSKTYDSIFKPTKSYPTQPRQTSRRIYIANSHL
ncbi:hypothetical protein HDV06_002001 [Boothiomyces sp. JEL0866]|nr:hypothetical protein HDV06_002001 [Boothiomyces sp. JEL0866]